jgi:hypothetical protein
MALKIPVLSSIRELPGPARRFLLFTAVNVISWQSLVGPAMVLYAREIAMPQSLVGLLMAFLPLSMLLIVFATPVVSMLGPKRTVFFAWLVRNILISIIFLSPLALVQIGPRAAWGVLLAGVVAFCSARAFGVSGLLPWIHSIVPSNRRGIYFSAEGGVVQAVNVLVMLFQAFMLRGDPGWPRFLLIFSVGVASGFVSLFAIARIPGGASLSQPMAPRESWRSYGAAWRDKHFRRFIATSTASFSALMWFISSIVLYMRDQLELVEFHIMMIMAAASCGVLLTIRSWGLYAEHHGSGRTMHLTLLGFAVSVACVLALLPGAPWTLYALGPVVILTTIFQAAFSMAAHRAMLNFVKAPEIGYTNIWAMGVALSLGVTPILAGFTIDHLDLTGFRICFVLAAAGAGVFGALNRWFVQDGAPLRPIGQIVLDPTLPVRLLFRVAWITSGMHPTSRDATENAE